MTPPGTSRNRRDRRAVLFDLDDTLFDCNSQLVLPAHREAVAAMIRAGLPGRKEELLQRRLHLFAHHPREDVDRLLAASFGLETPEVVDAGRRAFYVREVGPLQPTPGVPEILRGLQDRYRLFLVTAGDPGTQEQKVRRLGLEKEFEEVVYVNTFQGETKEGAFRNLLQRHRLDGADCIAVGDRVDGEIRAGLALGMRTIRLRQGEYAHLEPCGPEETPDHTLDSIRGLPALIRSLETGQL